MLDRNNGTISFEKGNLIHIIHVILQILRQLRAFGAHQRFQIATKNCGSLLDYLLSLLYQLPYYIIIFLTVCVYPPTRNSREGPLLR